MRKEILMALGIALLLFTPSALAVTSQYCENDTLVMIREVTVQVPERNTTRTINVMEKEICPWGCQSNECMQPPWIMWAIIIGVVLVFAFIYYAFFRPK